MTAEWRYYRDEQISSIYLNVYKRTLDLPGVQLLKQSVIDKMDGTNIAKAKILGVKDRERYDTSWIPKIRFFLTVPGRVEYVKTDPTSTEKIDFNLNLDTFIPEEDKILNFFAQNVGEERSYPIRMHGLMNMYSVRNGTKGNKNQYVPWFLNKIMNTPEVTEALTRVRSRLVNDSYKFVNNPEFNAEYIEARNGLGKLGVIEGLKNLKHLPLEVIKEALNEFLCMDVMDED